MAQTPEQRRAADAQRKRDARAREREKREAEKAAAADAARTSAPTTMRDAVEQSLKAMKWLVKSDDAAVAQARMLAKQVDELGHAGETTRLLSAHGRLTTVLDRLGGTPVVRQQHELRSRKLTPPEGDPDGGDSGTQTGKAGNVSRFERPKKRRAG